MPDYQFSTIKIAPQSARREPVAVGVILYDPQKGEIYRRFTDNWDEVRRRTGLATLPDLRSITVEGPVEVGDDYLASLSANQFPDTLLVTRPCSLMPFDTPRDALDWTFGTHVGLPPRIGGGHASGRSADGMLESRIASMKFVPGSYRRRYGFRLDPFRIRFPHVFLKDGVPCEALFAASISSRSATNAIRRRICDIASIRKWHGGNVGFRMCAVEPTRDERRACSPVRETMGLLDKWGVGVVYWDGVDDMLGQIRESVSTALLARPR